MSRYTIPNPPGAPEVRVTTVGWDAPLATFFARSYNTPHTVDDFDDELEVFWIGATPCEIPTVQHLADALRERHVELDLDMMAALAADQLLQGDRFAGRPATQIVAESARSHVPADQQARIDASLRAGDGR